MKSEIDELNSEVNNLDEQLKQNRTELEEINQQTKEEEGRLAAKREDVAKLIEERLLAKYERIRNAKSGLAVAPVKRNSCSGC